jgi:hypothetical protein
MPLQVRRGTDAERLAMTQPLAAGELVYVTNDQKLYVGDGATLGGIQITGYTDGDAKDSAAEIFTDGAHTGIGFTYNTATNVITATVNLSDYAGTIRADAFKGSVFADDGSTIGGQPLVDAVSGTLNGNLTGNVTGNVTGDVLGNVTGVVTGNIFTNLIDSADSSQIVVTPNVRFDADILVENELIVKNIVLNGIEHATIGQELFPIAQTGEVLPHYLTFVDAINGRTLVKTDGNLKYTPNTGTLEATSLISTSNLNCPTINSTNIITSNVQSNGALVLYSNLTTTSDTRLVTVGAASVDGRFQVATSTYYAGGLALVNINQSHSTADALNFQFNRSRGTLTTPTAAQSGDDIADITFAGFDGASNQVRATISATVAGAVSAGTVPMNVTISTSTNGSGAPVTAVTVNDKQQTAFAGAITLATYADDTARDAAITAPTAGMMVFNTTGTKFQGYTGAAWVDLN